MSGPRTRLASHVAAGLGGWFQLHVTQNLHGSSGEDAARFVVAQIVNAQGRYAPVISQLPPNWGNSKKRIDVALRTRSSGANSWYGAIEIKWPGASFDPHQIRLSAVQDAMRLAFICTTNLNALFLVIGGTHASLDTLFDKPHTAPERESRRMAFIDLFHRDPANPEGVALYRSWSTQFPEAGARIPTKVFKGFNGRLKTRLLAANDAKVGDTVEGHVYVWQCNRTRGTADSG